MRGIVVLLARAAALSERAAFGRRLQDGLDIDAVLQGRALLPAEAGVATFKGQALTCYSHVPVDDAAV